ncbi:MAG: class I SAM-dependent methyltransferase [Actinobacteria bacterium]|nr:class I SAM-dependent methyltransferase [Actinomycetota bacterium]
MLPPLVLRAEALAAESGFEKSCSREAGLLLRVLASQRGRARVAEIGTGCGVGAAWILSALPPETPFLTVELDPDRAAAATKLLADDEHARVLQGDWADVLPPEAPFDLLFADGGGQATKTNPAVLDLLAPGGTLVLDNLTPSREGPDPVRALWLAHPRLVAIELQLSPHESAIVGVLQAS